MFEQIKAIMCDLDGTLLTSEGTVSPRTVKAIEKAREKGLLFGLSTGRDVHGVKTLLAAWGIDGLMDVIVGTGGAEICDYRLGTESSSHPLDGELIKEIVRHFEDMPVNFAVPYLGTLYAPKDDENTGQVRPGPLRGGGFRRVPVHPQAQGHGGVPARADGRRR